ncbi:flocculation protein FLO11-like [Cucumis melo var. makuwa]|uniref:Flocculation protein FLO11-like n=1 Tax=Cucumis melo var. makuwa TaxID=1194695 RepID=A0A5A7TFA7_CUCMM|nr:flocculation protein FLO11-like [Cucumis melo var. makuwa]TYK14275.1 flocculation protein FLO11-like [Cucumis melo var. makuwa]
MWHQFLAFGALLLKDSELSPPRLNDERYLLMCHPYQLMVYLFTLRKGHINGNMLLNGKFSDEANIVDQYNSCPAILELIRNAWLIRIVSEVHIRGICFSVSPELLNTYLVPVWPVDEQLPVASLTVKYSILHRIRISNWIPSTHASIMSTSLCHFVYLVGTEVKVNVGGFIFNHLLRHSTILTPLDTVGSAPRVIPLSMRLFQGAHIPDVVSEFDNAPGGTSTPAASQSAVGHPLTLSMSLANRLLQALIVKSCVLTRQISELTDRRTMLDDVICDLRHAASGATPPLIKKFWL